MNIRLSLLTSLVLLLSASLAHGTITGPTSSSTGTFTLQWTQYQLREVTSAGVNIATYSGIIHSYSHSFTKSPGTYYFEEWSCGTLPFGGSVCYPTGSNHQVVVTTGGGSGGPESIAEQTSYEYQIRSGDFDSNGRTDLYVERLTTGTADGSMQSYVYGITPMGLFQRLR